MCGQAEGRLPLGARLSPCISVLVCMSVCMSVCVWCVCVRECVCVCISVCSAPVCTRKTGAALKHEICSDRFGNENEMNVKDG